MTLLNAIPYGKENAVSRAELMQRTGLKDRDIRDGIKKLNTELARHGEAILSSSGKRGYWRSSNVAEMKQYLLESRHRREKQFKNDEPIQRLVYDLEGVKRIPVRAHYRMVKPRNEDEGQVMFGG